MVDLGYRDRAYLSKYDLDVKLFEKFDLKVLDLIPIRKVFLIITDKGDKILKRIDCTLEEFDFVVKALEYISTNFKRVMGFEDSIDGKKYAEWKGEFYCIMNKVEGRECEFSNPVDLAVSAKGLGELHKASEGFRYKNSNKNICGNLLKNVNRKKEEMLFFKRMVNLYENKSEFDDIFLMNVDSYIKKIDDCITFLNKTSYYKLCSEEDKIVLCHHDLAHHNIIINDDNAYFVDFDFSVIDLKIHDLCNFINKVTKDFSFDIDKARIILDNYCTANTLNKNEFNVLFGMLTFPEDFYDITKDYYSKRKDWEEKIFTSRLKRKIHFEADRQEFLKEFKQEIDGF
ncbi:CotS family spore coat protein [Clostridium pasteurianum]|uniref:Spore coat protein, CotS family n=1 Tax=Clostridium pasteurianum BC1 TaxID=86416 RepID=R4JYJ8_CLOPA|nr:CotS family spore coat protein [Clostridium pasteurianum]AGK95368.1 spore coat protein, CotS family [Clostridium pasteurianum BC1]